MKNVTMIDGEHHSSAVKSAQGPKTHGFTGEEIKALEAIGISPDTVARFGDVRALRLDGKAVMMDGRIVPIAELKA